MAQVSEIASGSSVDLNNEDDGGQRVRSWRVVLDGPSAFGAAIAAVGVSVGGRHPSDSDLTCSSIGERSDGDSRLVRIVTATYTVSKTQTEDPGDDQRPPDQRQATYSISTSLMETAVRFFFDENGNLSPAVNEVGDPLDDITRLSPVTTIQVEQYENSVNANRLSDVGYINSVAFKFGTWQIAAGNAMFRGYTVKPTYTTYGSYTFKGYIAGYEFMIRHGGTGWKIEIPRRGLNIFNQNLNGQDVDNNALCLRHRNGRVVQPLALEAIPGNPPKCRAMVPLSYPDGGFFQRPASLPVALNADGTPRSPTANPPVLTRVVSAQSMTPFGDNFSKLGVRGNSW